MTFGGSVTVKASVQINTIAFEVMKRDGRDEGDKFVVFEIDNTVAGVEVSDAEFVDVSFGIDQIVITDLRPHSTSLYKRLLDASTRKKSFLGVSALMHTGSGALVVGARVSSPKVFFLPSLLTDLAAFGAQFVQKETANFRELQSKLALIQGPAEGEAPAEEFDFEKFKSELNLETTFEIMRNGIETKERGTFSKVESFKAVELVDFFCDTYGLERGESVRLCQHFIDNGYVKLEGKKEFADSAKCLCVFTDPALKNETKEEQKKRKEEEKKKKKEEKKEEERRRREEEDEEKKKRKEEKEKKRQEKEDAKKGIIRAAADAAAEEGKKEGGAKEARECQLLYTVDEETRAAVVAEQRAGRPTALGRLFPGAAPKLVDVTAVVESPRIVLLEDETDAQTQYVELTASLELSYAKTAASTEKAVLRVPSVALQSSAMHKGRISKRSLVRPLVSLEDIGLTFVRGNIAKHPKRELILASAAAGGGSKVAMFFSYKDLLLLQSIADSTMKVKDTLLPPASSVPASTSASASSSAAAPSAPEPAGGASAPTGLRQVPAAARLAARRQSSMPALLDEGDACAAGDEGGGASEKRRSRSTNRTVVPEDKLARLPRDLLTFDLPSLEFVLINDFMDRNLPLISLKTRGVETAVTDWTGDLRASVSVSRITADFFNDGLMAYEPLVEPWSFTVEAAMAKNPKFCLVLGVPEVISVNLTFALVDSLARTFQALSKDFTDVVSKRRGVQPTEEQVAARRREEEERRHDPNGFKEIAAAAAYAPHWVGNRTGAPVVVEAHGAAHTVADGAAVALIPAAATNTRQLNTTSLFATLTVEGVPKTLNLDRIGTKYYKINGRTLVAAITWNEDGSKLLTLSSARTLRNETTNPFLAVVGGAEVTVRPKERYHVPFAYDGAVSVRTGEVVEELPAVGERTPAVSHAVLGRGAESERELREKKKRAKKSKDENVFYSRDAYFMNLTTRVASVLYDEVSADPAENEETTETARIVVYEFYAPLRVFNELPVPVVYAFDDEETTVGSGESALVYTHDSQHALRMRVSTISENFDSGVLEISSGDQTKVRSTAEFAIKDRDGVKLALKAEHAFADMLTVTLYCPYWVVNQSYLPLQYQTHSTVGKDEHAANCPEDGDEPSGEPFILSAGSSKISVRVAAPYAVAKGWSAPFSIEAVGTSGLVTLADAAGVTRDLKIVVESCGQAFCHSKRVTISPSLVYVNRMSVPVHLRNGETETTLEVGRVLPAEWLAGAKGKKVSRVLRLRLDDHEWSIPFSTLEAGEFVVNTRGARAGVDDYYARVELKETPYTSYLIFTDEVRDEPPFRLVNDTDVEVTVRQDADEAGEHRVVLPAHTMAPLCFDSFDNFRVVVESPAFAEPVKFNISRIEKFGTVETRDDTFIYPYVKADGPTRCFTLTQNYTRLRKDMRVRKTAVAANEATSTLVTVSLRGLGVSVVDQVPRELLYLSVDDVDASLQVTEEDTKTELKVGNFQLDCMDMGAQYPVMVHPVVKEEDALFLHFSSVKSNLYTNIDYYTYYGLMVQELDIRTDGDFVFKVLDFVTALPLSSLAASIPPATPPAQRVPLVGLDTYKFLDVPLEQHEKQRMIYYGLYLFNPLKFDITFTSTNGQFLNMPLNAFTVLLQTFGNILANLDRAPICLNALMLEHCFCSSAGLSSMIVSHYTRQAIAEVYKILGSTDLLGNPVGLFNNVASGVTDFFYEPAKGIVTSPQAFGKGLANGTASLVKNSIFGVFNAVSKITGTLGKGVATLSMDDDYLAARQRANRKQAKHVGDGALQGVQALGTGIFAGIAGIVMNPVKGARKGGIAGFAKGVGTGIVGVVVKPVTGVFEFASKTTEGIRNTTTYFDKEVTRVHPFPRAFGAEHELHAYDQKECEGWFLLKQNGFVKDVYVDHEKDVNNKKIYVVTDRSLAVLSTAFSVKQLKESGNLSGAALSKCIRLRDITSIDKADSTIAVRGEKKPIKLTLLGDQLAKVMALVEERVKALAELE